MSDIRTVIISTAHRPESQSLRVAQVLKDHFLQGHADIVDLYTDALPMWDGVTAANDTVNKTLQTIDQADALIFVIPEWHGMAPAGLKNLLLWCGAQQQMAHKPVLLVGISAAVGGAFVIAEVRSSGYKNTRLVFTPEHLILRSVGDLWQEEGSASGDDYLSKRTRFAIAQLIDYAAALKPIRTKLVAAQAEFGNGMS